MHSIDLPLDDSNLLDTGNSTVSAISKEKKYVHFTITPRPGYYYHTTLVSDCYVESTTKGEKRDNVLAISLRAFCAQIKPKTRNGRQMLNAITSQSNHKTCHSCINHGSQQRLFSYCFDRTYLRCGSLDGPLPSRNPIPVGFPPAAPGEEPPRGEADVPPLPQTYRDLNGNASWVGVSFLLGTWRRAVCSAIGVGGVEGRGLCIAGDRAFQDRAVANVGGMVLPSNVADPVQCASPTIRKDGPLSACYTAQRHY